ncbi:MAG: Gfo/Idh/MocA family oxidoreductase [Verrucomicrobia bacterium]|nr:Gfo/Idh/MocA family oxidoreductase [Verrucomicrobiota bacterium]
MKTIHRRTFIKDSVFAAGGIVAAPAFVNNLITNSPNKRVNIALAGISGNRPRVRGMISGRGIAHINGYAKVPNAIITKICDVDERLFPAAVTEIEKLYGARPKTEVDFRRLCDDKDIDVISIATPDHWHALHAIWACQAGKDVYVEKPVCHNISEGRKMVQAARKYNRIVQAGICYRSSKAVKAAVKFIADGKMGKVYMGKGMVYAYRPSIERVPDSPIPEGVHWDTFLGPAPYRPFNENRYIYNWHWFWDTSTTEFGNNGIYRMDTVRWALNKDTHPVKVHCTGGKFCRDDDQEVPNILFANYEYEDGTIIQNELRSLPSNPEGLADSGNCFIYSDQGWMTISPGGFKTYFGPKNAPGPKMSENDIPEEERSNGWKNLIECVRSRRLEDLDNDILKGHMSAALGHLGVISYRTGRKLVFDPTTEKFVNDQEADKLLTRNYRRPYVVPDEV